MTAQAYFGKEYEYLWNAKWIGFLKEKFMHTVDKLCMLLIIALERSLTLCLKLNVNKNIASLGIRKITQ